MLEPQTKVPVMNALKLTQKVWVLVAVAVMGCLGTAYIGHSKFVDYAMSAGEARVQGQVQTARSLVESYHRRQVSGEMTERTAKDAAAAALGDLRYGDADYFWINDLTPIMVMHPI